MILILFPLFEILKEGFYFKHERDINFNTSNVALNMLHKQVLGQHTSHIIIRGCFHNGISLWKMAEFVENLV